MAESRWPDVVPARKEVGEQHLQQSSSDPSSSTSSEGGGGSGSSGCPTAWHISILAQNNPSDPPVVQIWTHNNSSADPSSPTDSPLPPTDDDLDDAGKQTRRCSNHSGYSAYSGDSGIDSQLSSPTVADLGSGKLHGHQAFVLDLSATHLAVPSKLKASLCTGNSAIFDYGASGNSIETVVTIENHKVDHADRNHPSESTDAPSHSSASQKRPQDLEPLQLTERPDSPVRHQQLSPKVNIIRFPKRRSAGSFDSCMRHDGSDIGSTESNGSNGLMNADQETDPGSVSYSSSRHMSISSELERSAIGSAAGKPPLLRSSSSRSAFLSVPVRIVPNCQQQQQHHQHQHHRRRPSFQLGSSSSLMMVSRSSSQSKTPSPTMSQYMRLAADGGLIDEIMIASMTSTDLASINGSDRLYPVDIVEDGRHYNSRAAATAAAAVASLSLTQRLAFPELVSHLDGDADHSSNVPKTGRQERYTIPREEGSLNFFAKIITFLVLVFVIVLVVGVLVKISHTPR